MRSAEARRLLEVYIANPETGARVPSLMVTLSRVGTLIVFVMEPP